MSERPVDHHFVRAHKAICIVNYDGFGGDGGGEGGREGKGLGWVVGNAVKRGNGGRANLFFFFYNDGV